MGLLIKLPRAKDGLWLTKDNKLIKMHSNMTATSYKLTNYILWKATKMDNIKESFEMSAAEIVKACNIKNNNYSKVLDEETSKIIKTWIEIRNPDNVGYAKITMMDKLEYHKGGILEAKISTSMASLIGTLQKEFTQNDYVQVNKCSSYAAMRLYEVCNSWLRTGHVFYSLEEWRKLMGGIQKTYDKFNAFKQRIFLPAVECVNKETDLTITPYFQKTGRKVSHIKVVIEKKEGGTTVDENALDKETCLMTQVDSPQTEPSQKPSGLEQDNSSKFSLEETDVIRVMMKDFKQTQKNAESYIQNYGLDYCKEQITYVRQENSRKRIQRIGGYFHRAIEQDYAGKQLSLMNAAYMEENERKNKEQWEKDIRKNGLIPSPPSNNEEELVKDILEKHPEIASLYQSMGLPDANVARWIEKYPEVLLFKIAFKLQGTNGVTEEYVEALLRSNQ